MIARPRQKVSGEAMTAWLERLEKYERESFREVPGPSSNPRILKWAHGAGHASWVTDDATPWCGIGLAGVLDECGLGHAIPPEPARAISWLKCGVTCGPEKGAIAVLPRTGGHHVTVVACINSDGTFDGLGCNQGDAIKVSRFKTGDALGFRWPIPRVTPGEMTNESRIAKAAQRQQRDTVISGGGGAGQLTPSQSAPPQPPAPESGWQDSITGLFDQGGKWRGWVETGLDFLTFAAGQWRIILGALAVYFLFRVFYDGRMIQLWRTQDQNEGFTK